MKPKSKLIGVVLFISSFKRINDYCPTVREIMDSVEISSTSVTKYYLEILRKWEILTWERKQNRTVRLLVTPEHASLIITQKLLEES